LAAGQGNRTTQVPESYHARTDGWNCQRSRRLQEHPEFTFFVAGMNAYFLAYRKTRAAMLKAADSGECGR
jgi:hypothetical protein